MFTNTTYNPEPFTDGKKVLGCLQINHPICVITRCAEIGRVPPARGVMVNAAALPAGFRTVKIELMTVVSNIITVTIIVPSAQLIHLFKRVYFIIFFS